MKCAAHADLSSMLYTCASQIDPIALPCLSPIHCFESGANIRGTAVLRGRAESKKGSPRMVLTTKAAYTKSSELLIRQFLCPRHGIHDDVKLAVLYRHRRPAGQFSDSCQSIIGRVSCGAISRISHAVRLFLTRSFFYFSP